MDAAAKFLGSYILPGRVTDPTPGMQQLAAAESLGLGSAWLSERYGMKELGALSGAAGQATEHIDIVAGVTHIGTRHPVILASWGMTMQALTGNRFVLGFGRGNLARWKAYGVPVPTNDAFASAVRVLRDLWAGETVAHHGVLGDYPALRLPDRPDSDVRPPSLVLAAVGPNRLRLAGQVFDGVALHPFLTPEGVHRSARAVHEGAVEAGRRPEDVKVYAAVVTAPEVTEAEVARTVAARAASYFYAPGLGDQLVRANGWDADLLQRVRSHPRVDDVRSGTGDAAAVNEALQELGQQVPDGWLHSGAAIGSSADCAERLQTYLKHGADEIVVHGTTADALGPLVDSFRGMAR